MEGWIEPSAHMRYNTLNLYILIGWLCAVLPLSRRTSSTCVGLHTVVSRWVYRSDLCVYASSRIGGILVELCYSTNHTLTGSGIDDPSWVAAYITRVNIPRSESLAHVCALVSC